MIVQVGNKRYAIKWHHERGAKGSSCTIEEMVGETRVFVGTGVALCSVKDQFCKETGRRVSLARAIKEFKRTERAQIWQAYWRQKTHGQENKQ